MSVVSKGTKGVLGIKAGRVAAKHPRALISGAKAAAPVGKLSLKASRPLLKRKALRQAEKVGEAARTLGEALVVYGPQAAYELGLAEPPKRKRTAPRLAAGIVIGAGAMYFLEPGVGRQHREKVAQLVG